ncbi:MAG TPA: TIGR03435 family protein [Terriglobales bacterium]|nr:TIGR03435 family protein [Terriglobales bacterium]
MRGQRAARLHFDAVSIRPVGEGVGFHPSPPRVGPVRPGGQYVNEQATLFDLVSFAYPESAVPRQTLIGLPDWAFFPFARYYAVIAKPVAGSPPTLSEMRVMMQGVLEKRFEFKAHVERRTIPVYFLDCVGSGPKGITVVEPKKEQSVPPRIGVGWQDIAISGRATSIAALAQILTIPFGRPVVDRTGFTETFDVDLPLRNDGPPPGNFVKPDRKDLLTRGLREKLGLIVTSGTAVVPVMIVDHVSPPTPN